MLRGLLILPEPLKQILNGRKSWEIRGKSTAKREQIALIESGSGTVVGVADLVDVVGPLTLPEFTANASKIGITRALAREGLPYKRTFAWVLRNRRRLKTPVPYSHKSGAIVWVILSPAVSRAVLRQARR